MRNTLKHLTLLTRMKDDGLLPTLTGSFSEDAIAQACGQVETLQLQERLHIRKTKRIQEELVRVPDFAALYGTLCRQEIGDEEIVPFPVSWTVKMKKKQKETQDILSYHTQAAGCSDKARAKASGGRQPIEECGRTGL